MSKHVPMFFLMAVLTLAILGGMACAAPLTVHPSNPRYFTDGSGKAVYLSGFEYWDSLLLDGSPDSDSMAWSDFLDESEANGVDLVRLWIWNELFKWHSNSEPGKWKTSPQIWQRSGQCCAWDGGNKFDLNSFNQQYFDTLQARVSEARARGFYVSVMLFEGYSVQFYENAWAGHPFNSQNNINGIEGDTNGDGYGIEVHTLESPDPVLTFQEKYVRKVIDTVNSYDNVLFEIINECGSYSTDWQYHMINYIKNYESSKPKQHPVGMSFQFKGGSNAVLFSSPAEWIAPNPDGGYIDNPPASDGSKVIISDTDHLCGCIQNRVWVWKSFTRGLNLINYMELPELVDYDPVHMSARRNMGYTLTYANRMNLASMTPQNSLSSTAYCLANPGSEYLAYQPSSGSFTVNLQAGTYSYEWFNPSSGTVAGTGTVTASGGSKTFSPPFSGDAVLYLKAQASSCGNSQCDSGECSSCPGDCTLSYCCGREGCNSGMGETCSTCPFDCGTCPSTNPIAWWKLDETSGTTVSDSSGNGNTGTLVNGPVWTTGKIGNALSFDGADDYVNMGDLFYSDVFTVCAWVKTNITGAGTTKTIVAKRNSNGITAGTNEWHLIAEDGYFSFASWNASSGLALYIDGATAYQTGTWYHVCGVQNGNGNTGYTYLNGVQDDSAMQTSAMRSTGDLIQIGVRTNNNDARYWNGLIDEVAIWNRALNQSEILSLYQNASCIHKSDSTCDGCVDMGELTAFIDRWKVNSSDVTLREIIEAMGLWKRGCP